MTLPRLYAIADRATLDALGMSVGGFAEELREAGVTLLQYRDKGNGPQEVLRAAAETAAVFAGVQATLILNDRADLAALAGWGVHVGQGDLSVTDARAVLRRRIPRLKTPGVEPPTLATMEPSRRWGTRVYSDDDGNSDGGLVGVSTHTDDEVRAADKSDANYVAIGPVFGTVTKLDAEAAVGLEGVRRARALTTKPLVAIGGITLGNARTVMEAGADSVAVISGLLATDGMSVREKAAAFLALLGE